MLLKAASHFSLRVSCILEQSPLIDRFHSASSVATQEGIFLCPPPFSKVLKVTQNLFFTCLPPSLSHHFICSPSFFHILHKSFNRHLWQNQNVEMRVHRTVCFRGSFLLICPQADWLWRIRLPFVPLLTLCSIMFCLLYNIQRLLAFHGHL